MPQVTIDGRVMHYETAGHGRPLLLLHGFPLSAESFWPQLTSPPAGCKVIAPDHRGFGRSTPGVGPATMELLADDAFQLLDVLGHQSALVGGVSMGGYVAMAMARLNPGRVEGLVLIDTQALADDEAGQARRQAVAQDVEAHGVDGLADSMLPKLLAPSADTSLRNRVERIMRASNAVGVAAASRGMGQRSDSRDVLSRFAGPALLIVGALDVITPPEKARQMASLMPQSTLCEVPSVGHLANLEAPDAVNEAIARFAAS
jgi:pimeloyl-ACP methyl ester carboxylesterase